MTEFFNDLIGQLAELKDTYIYLTILVVAYLENVFPPIPGDLLVIFAGYLISTGVISFPEALFFSTVGSFLGFIHLYGIGRWLGDSIMSDKKMMFLPKERIRDVNKQFLRFGYWLIIFNRFLAGTRAVISLFAGIGNLYFWKTSAAALFSALAWNALLLFLGKVLGNSWRDLLGYLQSYSIIVTSLLALLAIILLIRWYMKKKNLQKNI